MTQLVISGSPNNLVAVQVTIKSGASLSEMVSTQGMALVGVNMPAGWDAADLAYEDCLTGNKSDLALNYDSGGNAYKTTVSASHNIKFPTADALFTAFLAIASVDTTAGSTTPVNQTADRVLTLLFRRFLS